LSCSVPGRAPERTTFGLPAGTGLWGHCPEIGCGPLRPASCHPAALWPGLRDRFDGRSAAAQGVTIRRIARGQTHGAELIRRQAKRLGDTVLPGLEHGLQIAVAAFDNLG